MLSRAQRSSDAELYERVFHIALFLIAYLVLTRWILPKLGVPT